MKALRRIGLALPGVLWLAACAPQQQEFRPPQQAPRLTEAAFLPGDGSALALRHWKPKTRAKAVIVALHGFNDYSHAFAMPAAYFAARGIETYAYDQRGFGASAQPGIWGNAENLTSDAKRMLSAVRARHPAVPLFLLGESMGGAVAAAALAQPDAPPVDGLILSAPAVWGGEEFDAFFRATLWFAAHTLPHWELTGEGLEIQSSDNVPMLRALARDPLVIKKTRADAIFGLVRMMDAGFAGAEKLRAPVLLLYGANDQVVPPRPVDAFAARLTAPSLFFHYPCGWHMLMRDLNAEIVWRDVAEWVQNPGLRQ